jgi:YHS domain-containing protein
MTTLLLLLLGCGTPAPPAADNQTTPDAVLATADALDGTVDHVVVMDCPGCADDAASHTSDSHGYELRFCSATCKSTFDADPSVGLAVLTLSTSVAK